MQNNINFLTLNKLDVLNIIKEYLKKNIYIEFNKIPFYPLRNEEENIYNLIKDNKYFCSIENIDKDKLISIKDIYDKFELFNDINFYDFYIKYIPICIFSFIFRTYVKNINDFIIYNENDILITIENEDLNSLKTFILFFGYELQNIEKVNNKQITTYFTLNKNIIDKQYHNIQYNSNDNIQYNVLLNNIKYNLNNINFNKIKKYDLITDHNNVYKVINIIKYSNKIDIRIIKNNDRINNINLPILNYDSYF